MSENLKISIITATYNSAETLEDAMKSVLSQDYKMLEYLIVDGGSTDKTVQLITQYAEKYPIKWSSGPDRGLYDALNKGISRASGDIIGFVHSDDLLASPQIISKIAAAVQEQKVDGVYGDLQYVQREHLSRVIRYWKSQPFKPVLLHRGWMPPHPTLFLKKEVYEKHGSFDLTYKIAADYDFILRVFKDRELRFSYLNEVITKMRWGGVSNRNWRNLKLKSAEDLRILKANGIRIPYRTFVLKNLRKMPQFFKNGK